MRPARPYPSPYFRLRSRWLESLFLFLLLALATGFPYFWIGPLPAWLIVAVAGGLWIILWEPSRRLLFRLFKQFRYKLILPWILFSGIILFRDTLGGGLYETLSSRVFLLLATLGLFGVCVFYSFICGFRKVCMILAVFAALQGMVAVLQFSGMSVAWALPDKLSAISSRDVSLEHKLKERFTAREEAMGFEARGRVRGTHVFVHKFNAFQGVLCGFLLTLCLMVYRTRRFSHVAFPFLLGAALLAFIGLVLTFSRSPVLGLAIGFMVIFYYITKAKRAGPVLMIILLAVGSFVLINVLEIGESKQASRIFDFAVNTQSDMSRIESLRRGVANFFSSPILGTGYQRKQYLREIGIHSAPLNVLGSYGILGFIFYAWVWFSFIYFFYRKANCPSLTVHLLSLSSLCALIVALVDTATHTSGLLLSDVAQPALFGIFLGMILRELEGGFPGRPLGKAPGYLRPRSYPPACLLSGHA